MNKEIKEPVENMERIHNKTNKRKVTNYSENKENNQKLSIGKSYSNLKFSSK